MRTASISHSNTTYQTPDTPRRTFECRNPYCRRKDHHLARGLCSYCYGVILDLVHRGTFTWEQLEKSDKTLPGRQHLTS
jgi:hypothetical protein